MVDFSFNCVHDMLPTEGGVGGGLKLEVFFSALLEICIWGIFEVLLNVFEAIVLSP